MERAEIREIAEEVSEVTVIKTLVALGVDISSPRAIKDMQTDFAFLRGQRESAESVKRNLKKIGWYVFGSVVLGVVAWIMTTLHLPAPMPGP